MPIADAVWWYEIAKQRVFLNCTKIWVGRIKFWFFAKFDSPPPPQLSHIGKRWSLAHFSLWSRWVWYLIGDWQGPYLTDLKDLKELMCSLHARLFTSSTPLLQQSVILIAYKGGATTIDRRALLMVGAVPNCAFNILVVDFNSMVSQIAISRINSSKQLVCCCGPSDYRWWFWSLL